MSDIVERLAKAMYEHSTTTRWDDLCEAVSEPSRHPYIIDPKWNRDGWLDLARMAVELVRAAKEKDVTVRDFAERIVADLDAARKSGIPVDEHGIIEAGIVDALDSEASMFRKQIEELNLQIKIRDADIADLKAVHQTNARKHRERKKTEATRMLAAGMSYREIAASLGYKSPGHVHKMLNGGKP